jgi:cytochrome c peroxidase
MGLVLVFGMAQLHGQGPGDPQAERNRRLFTQETFNGNGRTCETCHSLATGTVSPQEAQARHRKNPLDPLFLFDGSDDGQGHGSARMQADATILVEIPLPANVSLADDPAARSVILRRGIPSTHNTPALDRILMLDGRDPNLPTQALHAIQRHFEAKNAVSEADLDGIAQFELTEPFYSSESLRRYARGGPAPQLPEGKTASEKRGRLFFVDAATAGDGKAGACAVCHSGPLLNQTNQFFPLPIPAGTRFQSVNVSEFNAAGNPVRPFVFQRPDGTRVTVRSPDPGRALITGAIDGDPAADGAPFFTSLNAFKIPSLWGVKDTAPYFHDNSAKTLEDVAAHYARFFLTIPAPIQLSAQDQADIVAYLKLLN